MPNLDLPPSYLETVRRLLASHVPGAEVWAYGSRINHQAHDGSDLDLVVRDPADPSRPQRDLWELREAFSESEIPILVDVFDWARIPEEFRSEIDRSHVVIWKGTALGEESNTDQQGQTRTNKDIKDSKDENL